MNPSSCECECDKSCNIDEYLDYSCCKCRKTFIDPLVEECTENIEETKLVNITVENENNGRCSFSIVYRVLLISIRISIYFVYCNYVIRNKYDLPY